MELKIITMKNVENTLTNFVTDLVVSIVDSSAYRNLPTKERAELTEKLDDHFEVMIIETFLNRIDPDDAEELQELMEKDEARALERMEEIAAVTPGLIQDIQDRLKREAQVWLELGQ